MVGGIQPWQWASWSEWSADGQLGKSADEKKEGGNQGDTPKGKHGGGGRVYDWRWVRELVLEGLRLLQESFSIFISFLSLDASKQCRDPLGVGFVLRT
jgi:hypothetical protein